MRHIAVEVEGFVFYGGDEGGEIYALAGLEGAHLGGGEFVADSAPQPYAD